MVSWACMHVPPQNQNHWSRAGVAGCAEQPFILQSMAESRRKRKHLLCGPPARGGCRNTFGQWLWNLTTPKKYWDSKPVDFTLADFLRVVYILESSRKSGALTFCYTCVLYGWLKDMEHKKCSLSFKDKRKWPQVGPEKVYTFWILRKISSP